MNFKKITALAGTMLMAGLSITTAAAASFPQPFVTTSGVGDVAIVYGANAAATDVTAAQSINTALKDEITSTKRYSAGDVKLTEEEIALGGSITSGKIGPSIQDNKLSSLKDEKLSWDDGTGSTDYDLYETIGITNLKVLTSLNDDELDGVALSNEKGLYYHLVFEDALNYTGIGNSEADTLYLEILGKEYEVSSMSTSDNSITITTSETNSFQPGDTYSVAGKTVTIGSIFDGSVEVSVDGVNEIVSSSKRINGIRVKVDTIGYNSNSPDTSRAVLKIGEDLTKTYSDGDAFLDEDEDEPLWTWDINLTGNTGDYIGVIYNANINDASDDYNGETIKYIGSGYTLPNNFAMVTLDSTTDVAYQDLKFYFEDKADLYGNNDTTDELWEDQNVLVIEAENEDSITVGSVETNTIYLYYNTTASAFEVYAKDIDEEYTPSKKFRLANNTAVVNGTDDLTSEKLATITIEDTVLDLNVTVTGGLATLTVVNSAGTNFDLTLGGESISSTTNTGSLKYFGSTAEEAESGDLKINTTDVSTKDVEIMDPYGIIVSKGSSVESQLDKDELTLSVPEDQVYAQVTVSMGGEVVEDALGNLMFTDAQVSQISANNVIVVGGSCINSAAATLLGGAYCGEEFTSKTNVGVNQYMIKAYEDSAIDGKFALLVAGYEAADTTAAVNKLLNDDSVNTEAGDVYSTTAGSI